MWVRSQLHIRLINKLQILPEDRDERSAITYAVVANQHQFGDPLRFYPDDSDQGAVGHIERRLPFQRGYTSPVFVAVAFDKPYGNRCWITAEDKIRLPVFLDNAGTEERMLALNLCQRQLKIICGDSSA